MVLLQRSFCISFTTLSFFNNNFAYLLLKIIFLPEAPVSDLAENCGEELLWQRDCVTKQPLSFVEAFRLSYMPYISNDASVILTLTNSFHIPHTNTHTHSSNAKTPYQRHGHRKHQSTVDANDYSQVRIWSWSESIERKTVEQCLGLARNLCGLYVSAFYGPTIQRLTVWTSIHNVTN